MCKKLQLLGDFVPPGPLPGLCLWPHWRTSVRTASSAIVYSGPLWGKFSHKKIRNPRKFDDTEEREARIHGWMTLTKMLVPSCLYCLNCTKFGQLILRKII